MQISHFLYRIPLRSTFPRYHLTIPDLYSSGCIDSATLNAKSSIRDYSVTSKETRSGKVLFLRRDNHTIAVVALRLRIKDSSIAATLKYNRQRIRRILRGNNVPRESPFARLPSRRIPGACFTVAT